MSLLAYGEIALDLIKTNAVDRTTKMSEDGTEYVHTDWTINVTAVYSPSKLATSYALAGGFPVSQAGTLPMLTDQLIRHYLMQPRRPLLYQEGGIDILDIPSNLPGGGAIDADNGPIPQQCTVTRINGSRMFYVNYVIKCFVVECPQPTACNLAYDVCCALMSSRYSRTEAIDDQYRSTLTTQGAAFFRSDVLRLFGANADSFRGFLVPPQLRGYKRKNMQFVVASSGTYLEWITTDVENFIDLGARNVDNTAGAVGITDMDMRYSVGPALGGEAIKIQGWGAIVNVTAWAKGSRDSNTLDICKFLIAVIAQKLGPIFNPGASGNAVTGRFPMGTKIVEEMFDKKVTVSMDYFVNSADGQGGLTGTDAPIQGWIGFTPGQGPFLVNLPDKGGINPQPPHSSGTRGTAAYELAVREFAEACLCQMSADAKDPTGTLLPPDVGTSTPPRGFTPTVQGLLPPPIPPPTPYPDIRKGGKSGFRSIGPSGISSYMEYDVRDATDTATGMIQLPVSGPPARGNPTDPDGIAYPNDHAWYSQKSCVNIRLFNPISKKTVKWAITRVGCLPEIPDPAPTEELDPYYTLIARKLDPESVSVCAGGGVPIYRISGEYTYSLAGSVPNEPSLPFPVPPYVGLALGEFTQTLPEDFLQGIINYKSEKSES